jgi:hypothetical protein
MVDKKLETNPRVRFAFALRSFIFTKQNNAEKTEQFLEVPTTALVNSINSLESQNREVTEKTWALVGKVG